MPLKRSYNNWTNFTINTSCPWNSHVSIFTPFISPTILYNPIIWIISYQKYCVISCICRSACENSATVGLPTFWSYSYCYWTLLEKLDNVTVCDVVVRLYFSSDVCAWECAHSDAWLSRFIWIYSFRWNSFNYRVHSSFQITSRATTISSTFQQSLFRQINICTLTSINDKFTFSIGNRSKSPIRLAHQLILDTCNWIFTSPIKSTWWIIFFNIWSCSTCTW